MKNVKVGNNAQKGFTLIEIAIVMVIIGLLIGGVLKGQEMISNAKVKRVVKLGDELRAAIMTYYDKYGKYPGDANNNGHMENGERRNVFADLVTAKLISGSYSGSTVPKHAFGGDVYGVYWVNPPGKAPLGHYIRFDNLPWDACLEIDTKYDDGVYNTGSITANENYVETTTPVANFYWSL